MKHLIEPYLKYHETAWAPSTMRTARSILTKCEDYLDESPKILHEWLIQHNKGSYTIRAIFIRITHLESWAGVYDTKFKEYAVRHQAAFKHSYQRKEVGVTYEEALSRISTLSTPYREHALGLLNSGLRISESYDVQPSLLVKGKGGKTRKVYGKIDVKKLVPKTTLWRKLRDVGLKPHDLRKLFATRLVERGASAADLCKIMGWSDIKTAYAYLQARDEGRLESLVASCKEES